MASCLDQRKDRVSAVSEVTKPSSQPHDEYSKNKDIFLSYSREDNDFVKKLKRDLESHGYSVWIDTDDIHTGADWHSVIGTALQNSKALIAVLTAKYLVSKYCKNELFMASHQKKPIFPIMLETVDFSSKDGAGVLLAVSSLNWTSFTGNDSKSSYSKSFTKLLEGLKHEGVLPSSKDKPH